MENRRCENTTFMSHDTSCTSFRQEQDSMLAVEVVGVFRVCGGGGSLGDVMAMGVLTSQSKDLSGEKKAVRKGLCACG